MKSLEETVKEQGGEEFLAMVKEVMMGLLIDNITQTDIKQIGTSVKATTKLFRWVSCPSCRGT